MISTKTVRSKLEKPHWVTGKVLEQKGSDLVLNNRGKQNVIKLNNLKKFEVGELQSFMSYKFGTKSYQATYAGDQRESLSYYSDVTLQPHHFWSALQQNKNFKDPELKLFMWNFASTKIAATRKN